MTGAIAILQTDFVSNLFVEFNRQINFRFENTYYYVGGKVPYIIWHP